MLAYCMKSQEIGGKDINEGYSIPGKSIEISVCTSPVEHVSFRVRLPIDLLLTLKTCVSIIMK